MRYNNQNAVAMRTAQAAYDSMIPPDDPPEPPNMDSEIAALMRGEDTDLVTFEQFRECAEDILHEYMPDVIELIMACAASTDPVLVERTRAALENLAHLAGTMLDEAWYESAAGM